VHYCQFSLLIDVPNGACRFASIARAAFTSFGSLTLRCLPSFLSAGRVEVGASFVTGFTTAAAAAGFVCLRGFVFFAPDRNVFEIFD